MNNFFKALYRKKVSGNAKRIIIAYKKTIIFYWLYKEKIRFFFIISTILRSYLHYFILLEFSIKRHDVIQYMYHLNTLDLFHLFENMSTNIFFLFRLFWWRIDTRIFIIHIIFLWYCTHELQIGLKIPIACTCVDIQIKGWISKVNTFNTYDTKVPSRYLTSVQKDGKCFTVHKKIESLFIYKI